VESLWILIPLSLVLAFGIGGLFWWSVGAGQFDDLIGPSERILQDDDAVPDSALKNNQHEKLQHEKLQHEKLQHEKLQHEKLQHEKLHQKILQHDRNKGV